MEFDLLLSTQFVEVLGVINFSVMLYLDQPLVSQRCVPGRHANQHC